MYFVGLVTGLTTAFMLFKILFSDKEEFFEYVKFWFTPDIVSMFRGQYWEDNWAELKLIIWLGGSLWLGMGLDLCKVSFRKNREKPA